MKTDPKLLFLDSWLPTCLDHGAPAVNGYCSRHGTLLHRLIFKALYKHLPPVVMHSCDNPRCINPAHLSAGTWDANNKDRARKGRSARAVLSRRKITQEQAGTIRSRYQLSAGKRDSRNGVSRLARDYNVDCNTIYNIVEGRTHV